jgi:hypothetical protein
MDYRANGKAAWIMAAFIPYVPYCFFHPELQKVLENYVV